MTAPLNLQNLNLEQPKTLKEEDNILTKQAYKECMKFTKNAAGIFSPKYSFFLQGIKLIREDDGRGMFGGMGASIGVLSIMASPIAAFLKVILGGSGVVGGAVGTAITGTAYGIEKAIKGIENASKENAEIKREQLSQNVIRRIQGLITNTTRETQKRHFKKHPEHILGIVAISIAFLSRNLTEGELFTSQGEITKEDLEEFAAVCQDYFSDVLELTKKIKQLNLGEIEFRAWDTLMENLKKLHEDKLDLEPYYKNLYAEIVTFAANLGSKVAEDEVFQKYWKKTEL